jgi:hypothetical protein
MISTDSSDQRAYNSFYDTYAPKLWGIIILSDLPMPESETILVNTLAKAWKQFDQHTRSEKHFFTQLIGLAYKEGLPVDYLKAIPRFNRSRDIP